MGKDFIGYFAVITEPIKGTFMLEIPDLPGCFSQGESLEEVIYRAQEALSIFYYESKGKLPPPTNYLSIQKSHPGEMIQMVSISKRINIPKPLETVKKTLTIPKWLNEVSERYNINFSKILQTALINHLTNLDSVSEFDSLLLND